MSTRPPTRACALLLLVCAAFATVPPAAATSYVPDMVLGPNVPAYVSGVLVGDQVTLAVASLSSSKVATTSTVTLSVAGVPAGLHEWTLSILSSGVTTSTSGFVLVDTRVEDVYGSILAHKEQDSPAATEANLTAQLKALEGRTSASDNATRLLVNQQLATLRAAANATKAELAGLPGHVVGNLTGGINVTVDQKANAQMLARMAELQAGNDAVRQTALAAEQAGTYGLYAAGGVAVVLLAVAWVLSRQAGRNRRETLVMLMLLATKAGITPDSPEFQQAMDAFDGKRKKTKKLKGKKGKAAAIPAEST